MRYHFFVYFLSYFFYFSFSIFLSFGHFLHFFNLLFFLFVLIFTAVIIIFNKITIIKPPWEKAVTNDFCNFDQEITFGCSSGDKFNWEKLYLISRALIHFLSDKWTVCWFNFMTVNPKTGNIVLMWKKYLSVIRLGSLSSLEYPCKVDRKNMWSNV